MPRISQFYGISIYMYYKDHAPPHFHAMYGDSEATFEIANANLIDGKLPRRAVKMVEEWAKKHQSELNQNWTLAQVGQPLNRVAPLS